jgi:hypothetical protein
MGKDTLHVCIAPARQIATVKQGKKVLKRYNFKTIVPFKIEQKESYSHDYSNWCVSERDSMTLIDVKVYCNETIQELKIKTLEYYLKINQL